MTNGQPTDPLRHACDRLETLPQNVSDLWAFADWLTGTTDSIDRTRLTAALNDAGANGKIEGFVVLLMIGAVDQFWRRRASDNALNAESRAALKTFRRGIGDAVLAFDDLPSLAKMSVQKRLPSRFHVDWMTSVRADSVWGADVAVFLRDVLYALDDAADRVVAPPEEYNLEISQEIADFRADQFPGIDPNKLSSVSRERLIGEVEAVLALGLELPEVKSQRAKIVGAALAAFRTLNPTGKAFAPGFTAEKIRKAKYGVEQTSDWLQDLVQLVSVRFTAFKEEKAGNPSSRGKRIGLHELGTFFGSVAHGLDRFPLGLAGSAQRRYQEQTQTVQFHHGLTPLGVLSTRTAILLT